MLKINIFFNKHLQGENLIEDVDLEENNLDFLKINLDENLDKNVGNLENLDKDEGNLKRKDNNIVFLENNLDENLDKNQVIHEIAPTKIEL